MPRVFWILELWTFKNGNLKINMGLGILTKLTLHSCSHPAFNESFLFSTRLSVIIIYASISQIKQIAFVLLGSVLDSTCISNISCTWCWVVLCVTNKRQPRFLFHSFLKSYFLLNVSVYYCSQDSFLTSTACGKPPTAFSLRLLLTFWNHHDKQ